MPPPPPHPHHTVFLTTPLLTKGKKDNPPATQIRLHEELVKYRQYDEMVQRLTFKIAKLKTKAKQRFKSVCISGVKKVVRLVRDY